MRCDEVATLLPSLIDGVDETNLMVERHVQACLRCQADLVRYRKLVRNLELLRTRYVEPTPGLLGDTLAAITDAAERGALRTIVTGRRLAYAGAIGGTVATAATALLIARSRRRSSAPRLLAS
jgi:anti-sigma factor RsiW